MSGNSKSGPYVSNEDPSIANQQYSVNRNNTQPARHKLRSEVVHLGERLTTNQPQQFQLRPGDEVPRCQINVNPWYEFGPRKYDFRPRMSLPQNPPVDFDGGTDHLGLT